jgi:hypothetical protein
MPFAGTVLTEIHKKYLENTLTISSRRLFEIPKESASDSDGIEINQTIKRQPLPKKERIRIKYG